MGFGDWLGDKADVLGHLRYGMSTADKEALASSRALPGAPIDRSENQDVANRYAAGYLFGREHPTIAPILQPLIDQVKMSWLPGLGGSSPDLQVEADRGLEMSKRWREQNVAATTRGDNPMRYTPPSPTPQPAPAPTPYQR